MKQICWILLATMGLGCADRTPPPARVPVPGPDNRDVLMGRDERKPLPGEFVEEAPLPPVEEEPVGTFEDPPLVDDRPPEQLAFLQAYRSVDRPRITVFVNRTLEGDLIAVDAPPTRIRRGDGTAVDIGGDNDTYLRPGQYDEVLAKQIDYSAVENILTDWMACGGQVEIMSPDAARKKLSAQQIEDLQEGKREMLNPLAQRLNTDVLIQVQAKPTKQTNEGLTVRLIVDAISVKTGQSIGRAVVDVPPPLDKIQINTFTRYVARRLMAGMTDTWMNQQPRR